MNSDLFAAGARAVYDNAQRNGLTWRLVPGTVLGDGSSATSITVVLDGDVETITAQSLIGLIPDATRVMIMVVPPQGNYIIGTYGPGISSFVDEVTRTTSVGTFTTTETLLDQITFNAVANVRYRLTWMGTVQSTVANDLVSVRARWDIGTTLASGGTLITIREFSLPTAGRGFPANIITTFVPTITAEISAGVLAARSGGTGNISSFADANREVSLLIERA